MNAKIEMASRILGPENIISGAEKLTRKQEQLHPISGWGLKGLEMNLPLPGL